MEATSGGGGMGNKAARLGGGGGLARFRSAPVTWLDALLEEDLTKDDTLKVGPSSGGLTLLLTTGTTNPPATSSADSGLAQSNSSSSYSISAAVNPGFFDGSGGPQQSNLGGFHRQNSSPSEFLKQMRETDSDLPSPSKFTSQLVQRTRISDMIRKLQELVPNMDKRRHDRSGKILILVPSRSYNEAAQIVVPDKKSWKNFFAYMGPGFLVSMAYIDPVNLETDLQAGAQYKYGLLWIILLASCAALIIQTLSANLGVVTGKHLAEHCKAEYPKGPNFVLWALDELAVVACDIPEGT